MINEVVVIIKIDIHLSTAKVVGSNPLPPHSVLDIVVPVNKQTSVKLVRPLLPSPVVPVHNSTCKLSGECSRKIQAQTVGPIPKVPIQATLTYRV